MASSTTVYINGAYDEPVAAQHNFQTEYSHDDPLQVMNSYARYISPSHLGLSLHPFR